VIEVGNGESIHVVDLISSKSFDRLASGLIVAVLNSLDCPASIILDVHVSKLAIHQTKAHVDVFARDEWCQDVENETQCAQWDFVVPRGPHREDDEVE